LDATIRMARITGVLYLVIIVGGLFSEVVVRAGALVAHDAAATARNILASESLFRLGFASDVVVFLSDVAVAVLLYVLLQPVSRTLSLAAAAFRLTGTAIYGVNLLNHIGALLVLGDATPLAASEPAQAQALSALFLELHRYGYDLGLAFFGLHCLLLGVLLWRSREFPGILGILMGLAAINYLVGSFTLFLHPEGAPLIAPIYVVALVAELSLCLWLLIRGVRRPA
jgi:hypothetical protein